MTFILSPMVPKRRNIYGRRALGPINHLVPTTPAKTCQWLHGEPKDRDFCGRPVKPGSSYCEDHHRICHLPAPEGER